MTRPLTLRLDEPDYDRLHAEAAHLGMKPGTLARVLLHASLSRPATRPARRRSATTSRRPDPLARLAALTADLPDVDAVQAAQGARNDLERRDRARDR